MPVQGNDSRTWIKTAKLLKFSFLDVLVYFMHWCNKNNNFFPRCSVKTPNHYSYLASQSPTPCKFHKKTCRHMLSASWNFEQGSFSIWTVLRLKELTFHSLARTEYTPEPPVTTWNLNYFEMLDITRWFQRFKCAVKDCNLCSHNSLTFVCWEVHQWHESVATAALPPSILFTISSTLSPICFPANCEYITPTYVISRAIKRYWVIWILEIPNQYANVYLMCISLVFICPWGSLHNSAPPPPPSQVMEDR